MNFNNDDLETITPFELTEIEADIRPEDIKINPKSKEELNHWREALEVLGEPAKITLVYLMRKFNDGGQLWVPNYDEVTKQSRRRAR